MGTTPHFHSLGCHSPIPCPLHILSHRASLRILRLYEDSRRDTRQRARASSGLKASSTCLPLSVSIQISCKQRWQRCKTRGCLTESTTLWTTSSSSKKLLLVALTPLSTSHCSKSNSLSPSSLRYKHLTLLLLRCQPSLNNQPFFSPSHSCKWHPSKLREVKKSSSSSTSQSRTSRCHLLFPWIGNQCLTTLGLSKWWHLHPEPLSSNSTILYPSLHQSSISRAKWSKIFNPLCKSIKRS